MELPLREKLKQHELFREGGFLSKLELREFISKGSKINSKVNGNRYSLVQPEFAEFKGSLKNIPKEMHNVLENGKMLVLKHSFPYATYGTQTFFLSKKDGQYVLKHPSTNNTWTGKTALDRIKALRRRTVKEEWVPKPHDRQWIIETNYNPAKLDGRNVVETRHFYVPFTKGRREIVGSVALIGHNLTRSVGYTNAQKSKVEDSMAKLYIQYGGHTEKEAMRLALEWKEAAAKIAGRLSTNLHRFTSHLIRKPFSAASIQEGLAANDPFIRDREKTFLRHGWAVDLAPAWNPKTKRFDMALVEVQAYPGLMTLFHEYPELEKSIRDRFRKLDPKKIERLKIE
ncbi:hypothetical protein HY989_06615 [Candidatus Micrarchaeota archaeon]|nr:hypothetical protein [Candidatus Micrarchaeota archaeon]